MRHSTVCCIPGILATLAICAVPANADNFEITINPVSAMTNLGDPSPLIPGSGSFSTDGICSVCTSSSPGEIQAYQIDFAGFDLFDLTDPFTLGAFTYNVTTHALTADLTNFGSEVFRAFPDGTFSMDFDGVVFENGTYSVAELPEPRSIFLLSAILIAVGVLFRDRHSVRRRRQE